MNAAIVKDDDDATRFDPSGLSAVLALRVLPLRFRLTALTKTVLPEFAGNTLRGAFGYALRETVCVTRAKTCEGCSYRSACAYPYVFETPIPEGSKQLVGVTHAPVPYRLRATFADPGRTLSEGDCWEFGIDLFGRAVELASAVIAGVERMAGLGIGASRGRSALVEVDARVPQGWTAVLRDRRLSTVAAATVGALAAPLATIGPASGRASVGEDAPDTLRVEFTTPVRMRFEGDLVQEVPFHLLIRTLLRRASSLLAFHEHTDLDVDYRQIIDAASRARIGSSRLARADGWRFSTRQRRTMNLHGMIGSVTYDGAGEVDLPAFVPLLQLGELVGVGKGTSFGLGQISVHYALERA